MVVICAVCDGEDFNEVDGEYYCTVCNTQSQDLRLVEAEEFVADFTFTKLVPSGSKPRSSKKRDANTRPWTSDEAFLIILNQQAKALVELGAYSGIRDLLFKLWTTYLQRAGVAFCDETSGYRLRRERDRRVGNRQQPRLADYDRKRAALRRAGLGFDELPDEAIEKRLDPTGVSDDDEFEAADTGKTDTNLQSIRSHPFYMQMATTLAICQIALLYTTDLVIPTDIIKWVRNRTLPYLRVIDMLPDHMELTAMDLYTFLPVKQITSRSLRLLTGRLLYRLGVTSLPPVDIERLICRYVAELELPVAINGLACRLYRSTYMRMLRELRDIYQALPSYGAIAMSYILTVLQMKFGCDDVTEKRISRLAKHSQSSEPLFVWSDWVVHIEKKVGKRDAMELPEKYCDIKTVFLPASRELVPKNEPCRKKGKVHREEVRSALQSSLKTLITRCEARLQFAMDSSFDIDRTLFYDTPDRRRTPVLPETVATNFRATSIDYDSADLEYTGSGRFDVSTPGVTPMEEEFEHVKPYENYCIQWRDGDNRECRRSETYTWLLDVCCRVADCDPADVDMCKERLELAFFIDFEDLDRHEIARATAMRKRMVRTKFFSV